MTEIDIIVTGRRIRRGVGLLSLLCLIAAAACLGLTYLALVAMDEHRAHSMKLPF
jgi:hypothetical protein